MKISYWLYASLLIVLIAACAPQTIDTADNAQMPNTEVAPSVTATVLTTLASAETPMPFELTSSEFEDGGTIPRDFACTGANQSPELNWSEPPVGTQSFAIIFNDPDASSKGFVHWLVYNIPGDARSMPANVPSNPQIHDSAVHGSNSWGRTDYGGPCPPEGSTHNYVFSLYALDGMLNLDPGATKDELLAAMEGHVLAEVKLSAKFSR